MHRIRPIDLHREVLAYRIGVGRTLAVLVTSWLVLTITVSLAFGAAVRAGIAPDFDQQIVLSDQHHVAMHNGSSPIRLLGYYGMEEAG
jgi:hypothetical protein